MPIQIVRLIIQLFVILFSITPFLSKIQSNQTFLFEFYQSNSFYSSSLIKYNFFLLLILLNQFFLNLVYCFIKKKTLLIRLQVIIIYLVFVILHIHYHP